MNLHEGGKAAVLVAAIVVAASLLVFAAQAFRPQPPALTEGIFLSVVVEGTDWTIRYSSDDTRNNTVFSFLLEAARTNHFTVSWTNWSPPYSAVFVDEINGARNGDGGRWWQFWVDGEYGTLGADLTVLRGGETVTWRFVPPEG